MLLRLGGYLETATTRIRAIPADRTAQLDELASYVTASRAAPGGARISFICTHNSRRSQMAQLWAAAAAHHLGIDRVECHSGGTEVTAFHPNAVAAIERAGFEVDASGGDNPHYRVRFSPDGPTLECFSKAFDDPPNPSADFAAVMTCSDADAACPFVPGASARFRITYDDPKVADSTEGERATYDARCLQIATEMLYAFSRVR